MKLREHIKLNLSRKGEQQATPCRRGAGTEDRVKDILCPLSNKEKTGGYNCNFWELWDTFKTSNLRIEEFTYLTSETQKKFAWNSKMQKHMFFQPCI